MGLFSKSPLERFAPSLLDRLPQGVVIARLDDADAPESLRVLHANPVGAEHLGSDSEAAVGRRWVDLAPAVGEDGLLGRLAEAARSGMDGEKPAASGSDAAVRVDVIPLGDRSVAAVFGASPGPTPRSDDALSREQVRCQSLIRATDAHVWATEPSGEFVTASPRWLEVTGQTDEGARGWGWLNAIHPDDRERTAEAWREAVATGQDYEVEHRLQAADGSYRRMAVRATPLPGPKEDGVEWIGLYTDIEDRSAAAIELAASDARFRTLFDAIADVVLLYPLGPDGAEPFVLFNEAAVETYGYTAQELTGMTVADLIAPERMNLESALSELRRNRQGTFDSLHLTQDGRRVPMSTKAQLVEYDDRLCVLALCRDDSDRRQFRRQLSRENHGLERSVADRTARLEAFAEDLKILHRITTADHPDAASRFEAYLQAGCEMFDLPVGILASTPVDAETGTRLYRLEAVVSPSDEVRAGLTIPLADAFCDAVVAARETVVYGDAAQDPVGAANPACAERGFRAFIGTPVIVDGELYGTLNFVSPDPRPDGFAPYERDLVEVMAEAIGRDLHLDRARAARARSEPRRQAAVEAFGSHGVLQAVLATASDGLMALQAVRDADDAITDFTWTLVSPRAAEILGHDEQDLLGARLLEVFPGAREAGLFDACAGTVATGSPVERVEHCPLDGLEASFRISAMPIAGEDGVVVAVAEVVDPDPGSGPGDGPGS